MRHQIIKWFVAIALLFAGLRLWWWLRPERHAHCIKGAIFTLSDYAHSHDGQFPRSERGWGDALLQLGTDLPDRSWISEVVGVDDDGSRLVAALDHGTDVAEKDCTRIYVQGLSEKSAPGIAILFDRYSVQGGDHFRGERGQPMLREVISVDGSHRMIKDADWPAFVTQQKALLRGEGFSEEAIQAVYGP